MFRCHCVKWHERFLVINRFGSDELGHHRRSWKFEDGGWDLGRVRSRLEVDTGQTRLVSHQWGWIRTRCAIRGDRGGVGGGAPGQGLIPRKVVTSCGDRLREDLASPVCGLRNTKGSGRSRNGMSKNLQVWRMHFMTAFVPLLLS